MDDFKPSAFTPFLRRFTDERARDLQDTQQLYYRVRGLHQASGFAKLDADFELGSDIYARIHTLVPDPARSAFCEVIDRILKLERCLFEFPEIDWNRAHLSLKEATDLRHFLRAKEHLHAHETSVLPLLTDGLSLTFGVIAEQRNGRNEIVVTELDHEANISVWIALQQRGLHSLEKAGVISRE